MVWAVFWDDRRIGAYIMDWDFESKKHRYSANSYIKVLNEEVALNYPGPGYIFMQDNASIYTARKVTTWFTEHRVTTFKWPLYSPDLNPIEYTWNKLKTQLYYMFSAIANCTGIAEADMERLQSVIQVSQDTIPKEFFDNLYQMIPNRITAYIEAKG